MKEEIKERTQERDKIEKKTQEYLYKNIGFPKEEYDNLFNIIDSDEIIFCRQIPTSNIEGIVAALISKKLEESIDFKYTPISMKKDMFTTTSKEKTSLISPRRIVGNGIQKYNIKNNMIEIENKTLESIDIDENKIKKFSERLEKEGCKNISEIISPSKLLTEFHENLFKYMLNKFGIKSIGYDIHELFSYGLGIVLLTQTEVPAELYTIYYINEDNKVVKLKWNGKEYSNSSKGIKFTKDEIVEEAFKNNVRPSAETYYKYFYLPLFLTNILLEHELEVLGELPKNACIQIRKETGYSPLIINIGDLDKKKYYGHESTYLFPFRSIENSIDDCSYFINENNLKILGENLVDKLVDACKKKK